MSTDYLRNYRILLADSDQELSHVIKTMLHSMGFTNVRSTRSGKEAQRILQRENVDFLLTEWNLQQMDGMDLIQSIRHSTSLNPTLPIIMLSGRAERSDVEVARDAGINEFVVKPFNARTIFNRIERIIEQPRNFVVVNSYIGPDRRHKGAPPPGTPEKRTAFARPTLLPKDVHKEIIPSKRPKIWLPDFSLKYKLGSELKLNDLITPAVLDQAQAAIDAISTDSLKWIKDNIQELELLYSMMAKGEYDATLPMQINEAALMINSRAGTFGYERASEIAYMLYLFCRNRLQPDNPQHHIVIKKHIEVLKVIFGHNLKGDAGTLGQQIVHELRQLVEKYSGN